MQQTLPVSPALAFKISNVDHRIGQEKGHVESVLLEISRRKRSCLKKKTATIFDRFALASRKGSWLLLAVLL